MNEPAPRSDADELAAGVVITRVAEGFGLLIGGVIITGTGAWLVGHHIGVGGDHLLGRVGISVVMAAMGVAMVLGGRRVLATERCQGEDCACNKVA